MSENKDESSALSALKMACLKRNFKSFKDLMPGEYIVKNFSIVNSTHGPRIRIDLADYTYMYLPERFINVLTQDKIDTLNLTPKVMIFSGKETTNRDRLILDFRELSYMTEMLDFILE